MTNNDDDGPYGPSAFALGVGGDLRRTDEWDFFFPFVCPSQWLLDGSGCRRCRRRSMDLRRTDEWDKFYSIRLSVTLVARWYLADASPQLLSRP